MLWAYACDVPIWVAGFMFPLSCALPPPISYMSPDDGASSNMITLHHICRNQSLFCMCSFQQCNHSFMAHKGVSFFPSMQKLPKMSLLQCERVCSISKGQDVCNLHIQCDHGEKSTLCTLWMSENICYHHVYTSNSLLLSLSFFFPYTSFLSLLFFSGPYFYIVAYT